MSGYTKNSLIEQPAIALFADLGWETANCFNESFHDSPSPSSSPSGRGIENWPSPGSSPSGRGINVGRETPYDVVLEPRLRVAFRNPFGIHPHLFPLPEGEELNSAT